MVGQGLASWFCYGVCWAIYREGECGCRGWSVSVEDFSCVESF